MTPITYNLDGEHTILLTPETEERYESDPEVRTHVEVLAQTRANNTGHACEVFRRNGSDLLLQKMPEAA